MRLYIGLSVGDIILVTIIEVGDLNTMGDSKPRQEGAPDK